MANPATQFKKGNKEASKKRSKKAKKLANSIDKAIRNGSKLNMYDLLLKEGYKKATASRKSKRAINTKSFQEQLKENGTIEYMMYGHALSTALLIEWLMGIKHEGQVAAIHPTDLSKINRDLVHDIQLLSGQDTDRFGGQLSQLGDVLKNTKS